MSRAYRIRVKESLQRLIRAEDHVSTRLEVLEILPAEQMAELLARELERRGYSREGGRASKTTGGITVEIELDSGTVTVRAESSQELRLNEDRETLADTDWSDARKSQIEERLKTQVQRELKERAAEKQTELQRQVTNRLEQELGDIRVELDGAVNRATAEALKQRAAQIGQIKELTEDPESGSLTIVVEV